MTDPVQDLIDDMAGGCGLRPAAYAPDVALDATLPGWRLQRKGRQAVTAELSGWYTGEGSYEQLRRTALPGGELVTFTLTWTEHGVPHAVHQAHVLALEEGLVVRHDVWCGGRWSAELLAEMADA
jgi:hypothetical protein